MPHERIIYSLTDTDLYKFTMMQAVANHYPQIRAGYQFINRGKTSFPPGFSSALQEQIEMMSECRFTNHEEEFLQKSCGHFLKPTLFDLLKGYRFDPRQVHISQTEKGELNLSIEGLWYQTILWEVPLLAIISELYFKMTGQPPDGEWQKRVRAKGDALRKAGARFADFGTRRRYSYEIQEEVIRCLIDSARKVKDGGVFIGTSNVHFARLWGLTPIGTVAHEWFMAHAAMFGYRWATAKSLQVWADEFEGQLGIALSDTFTTPEFLRHFNAYFARLFDGVRQDSGDPFEILEMVINHYLKLHINPLYKTFVPSDGLDVSKVLALTEACQNRIQCSFGIGTNLTNDVGVEPLNMVIKLSHIILSDGTIVPTIKLSDNRGKYTGDLEEIVMAIRELRLPIQAA
ncbi:MAG: nicotinate phosphoribosyltransferase [Candidatus Marinimicrobia bacterium]|nr:nicotinate phosphoribosyltransferase [Candidatus Neomarinimicrobiota bacterium]